MAGIMGINLKAIKKTVGREGDGFLANVYLNNKKIGTVADYGDGGGYEICIEQEKKLFEEIVQKYYEKYPELDNFALKSTKEYLERKAKGTLPMRDFSKRDDFPLDEVFYEPFFSKLYCLHCLERDFKKGLQKGYSALVIVSYVYIPGEPLALDEAYYTGGSKEAFEEIKSHVKRLAFEITQYTSMNDFVIA
nr:hypothetical protein [uncultured Blautia sp.]